MGQIKNKSKGISAVIAGTPVAPGGSLTVAFKEIPEYYILHPEFEVYNDSGKLVEKTKSHKAHTPRAGGARVGSSRTEPKSEKEPKDKDSEKDLDETTKEKSPKKEDED